jgi:hypothetical protein
MTPSHKMRHKTTSKNFSGIFFYIFCDIKDQILKFLLFFTFLSCFEIFHLFALKGKSYHSAPPTHTQKTNKKSD